MKKFSLIGLLVVLASFSVDAQLVPTKITAISIDNKVTTKEYKIILFANDLKIQVPIKNNSFQIPECTAKNEKIGMQLHVANYDLDFGLLNPSLFGQNWRISIDTFPFTTEGLTKREMTQLKIVYVLSFASGGELLFKVTKNNRVKNEWGQKMNRGHL